ncbi:MAG: hypothetical protein KAR44_12610 [Candidatus Aegiribacteria sp.]|nr:hypothetical protein [Candidatus Aegiribacteria sp.]
MDIKTTLRLNTNEKRELARILNCDQEELPTELEPYAEAALEEFVSMFLGQRVFTRGSDLLEYRLYLLMHHAFGAMLPDEQTVCKLFQVTATASRSLIRAVMSKYQYSLKAEIDETLRVLLDSAQPSDTGDLVAVAVHNLNLVDELNRELAEIDTDLPSIRKRKGSVSTYVIQPSSYLRLCERFSVAKKLEDEDE